MRRKRESKNKLNKKSLKDNKERLLSKRDKCNWNNKGNKKK